MSNQVCKQSSALMLVRAAYAVGVIYLAVIVGEVELLLYLAV